MDASITPLVVAVVGFFSALAGGMLQAIYARSFETLKFERQPKWELYSSYFTVLGELSFSDDDIERRRNALSFMAQLRGRIGVVGSSAVVRTVGRVFHFEDLQSAEAQSAMVEALIAMRHDVRARRSRVPNRDLLQLMFGNRNMGE